MNFFRILPWKHRHLPNLSKNQYWGRGSLQTKTDESINPFRIQFTDTMITDLKQRLKNTRYAKPYEDATFKYGFNQNTLKTIVDYWANKYNFSEREIYLNQYGHYITNIQGLNIHFMHIKPKENGKKIIPMLMLHGWPGSVREFYKIIPLLIDENEKYDTIFELIIPSLPGFGFSQGPSKPGLGPAQIAVIMSNLMNRLGHKRYCVQGGDWGSVIGSHIATLYPQEVIGYHTNMPYIYTSLSIVKWIVSSFWPSLFVNKKHIDRIYPVSAILTDALKESGYFHQQSTKPETTGVGMDDSPAALAAWILEKFSTGTNKEYRNLPDGGITQKFTYEELIDNLMFYWVSKSATSAARIYAEGVKKEQLDMKFDLMTTNVPVAVARFPNEIGFFTKWQLKEKYLNIVQITDFDEGGHFAAFENPHVLAADIRLAVEKFDKFHLKKN